MNKLPLTTLCYIENEDSFLMMHRIKKENDINKDKWIGVGGHFEPGESPDDCLQREVLEETGLTLADYRLRGIITGPPSICFSTQPRRIPAPSSSAARGNWSGFQNPGSRI